MTTAVHGHDVLQMMIDADHEFTRPDLEQAILDRFGEEARFFTCSAEGLSAAELIDLLSAKGKFIESESGLRTRPDRICSH